MVIIGILLLIGVVIAVKLYDKEIRKKQWAKAAVNVSFIAGVIFLIVGIVQLFIS